MDSNGYGPTGKNLMTATLLTMGLLSALITIGMLTPLILRLTSGVEIGMEMRYFNNRSALPTAALVILMTMCLLVGYIGSKKTLMVAGGSILITLISALVSPFDNLPLDITFPLIIVAFIAVLYGTCKNAKRRDNYSRYRGIAAHVIHLGILLILIGIVASSNMKAESSLVLTAGIPGDFPDQHYSMTVTDMTSDFRGSPYKYYKGSEYVTLISFDVFKNGKYFDSGEVEYITDLKWGQSYTTTYINRGIGEELFIVPKAVDETTDRVNMYVRTVPLITFLWTGLLVMAGGMLVLGILEYSRDSRVLRIKSEKKQCSGEVTK